MTKQIWPVLLVVLFALLSKNVQAQCPIGVPQSVVFFGNGMDTPQEKAVDILDKLKGEILPRISSPLLKDCTTFDLAHNTNELGWVDLLQGYVQAISSDTSGFWRIMARLQIMPSVLQRLFSDIAITLDKINYISDSDLRIQVEQYRHEIQDNRKKVILISHSQGNFYANEAYNLLSGLIPISSNNFELVSVANPDSFVAGSSLHTTLYGDVILIVPGRQDPNTDITGTLCSMNGQLPGTNSFGCHDFIDSYLAGTISKPQILSQIISALPIPSVSLTLPNTGSIPEGGIDPNYVLLSGPSCPSGNCPVYATVTDNFPLNSPWPGNTSTSRWIEPINGTTDSHPVGQYIYRLTFQINGDPNTVTLNGQWASDNTGTDILVNGISTGLRNSDAGQFKFNPFSITTGLQSGTNTLDFVVFNDDCGGCENPTGLRVEFTDPN